MSIWRWVQWCFCCCYQCPVCISSSSVSCWFFPQCLRSSISENPEFGVGSIVTFCLVEVWGGQLKNRSTNWVAVCSCNSPVSSLCVFFLYVCIFVSVRVFCCLCSNVFWGFDSLAFCCFFFCGLVMGFGWLIAFCLVWGFCFFGWGGLGGSVCCLLVWCFGLVVWCEWFVVVVWFGFFLIGWFVCSPLSTSQGHQWAY